jgi:AcrR family transcriptional regulator
VARASTTSTPATPSADPGGDDARSRILDAAEDHFAREGFEATSTAKVASQAQVPKGLLFYYFPRKIDLLRTLLDERLPTQPLGSVETVARRGDVAGSLLRLATTLGLGEHESVVLRTILFREADTHPEVREHIRRLRRNLQRLTEEVLDAAVAGLDPGRRRAAAQAYVAVMLDEATTRRFGLHGPDLAETAGIVAGGLAT